MALTGLGIWSGSIRLCCCIGEFIGEGPMPCWPGWFGGMPPIGPAPGYMDWPWNIETLNVLWQSTEKVQWTPQRDKSTQVCKNKWPLEDEDRGAWTEVPMNGALLYDQFVNMSPYGELLPLLKWLAYKTHSSGIITKHSCSSPRFSLLQLTPYCWKQLLKLKAARWVNKKFKKLWQQDRMNDLLPGNVTRTSYFKIFRMSFSRL